MSENTTTISSCEYKQMIQLIDACCLRMGVESPGNLYGAVKCLDEAVKKFVQDNDGGAALRTWWGNREF